MNARTNVDIIDRFYGSHIKSILDRGTEVVDRATTKRKRLELDQRYDAFDRS